MAHASGLLAFCEPLDLDTLCGLVGSDAVEQAERRGFFRTVEDRGIGEVRFNQLLLGDVEHVSRAWGWPAPADCAVNSCRR